MQLCLWFINVKCTIINLTYFGNLKTTTFVESCIARDYNWIKVKHYKIACSESPRDSEKVKINNIEFKTNRKQIEGLIIWFSVSIKAFLTETVILSLIPKPYMVGKTDSPSLSYDLHTYSMHAHVDKHEKERRL